jgi:hypothetical protein
MNADVHEGRDGWLFLTGVFGTLYDRDASRLPDAKLRGWVILIEASADRLQNMAIRYVHMPAPEKLK